MKKGYPKIPILLKYLILAGDIGSIKDQIFKDFMSYHLINYIFGNHEFYSIDSIEIVKQKFFDFFATFNNVILLDNSSIIIEDISIYGFICWILPIFSQTHIARKYLNDYNQIRSEDTLFTINDYNKIVNNEIEKFANLFLILILIKY